MGPLKYLFSGVRLLTVLSITAIVGGIVLQGDDIAETAKRLSDSPSQLQGWIRGQGILVSQAGDCSAEQYPSWPDCEKIECMSDNHYACTLMKSTSGGSGGGCSGSPPTSSSWCENGAWKESTGGYTGGGGGGSCPGSPPTSSSWCDTSSGTPTWKESTGGYTGGSGGGAYCSGTPPTSSSWCDYSTSPPSWRESTGGYTGGSGGEWEATPAVQESCRNECTTVGHFPISECQTYCKDGNWSGPGGSSGGTGGTSSMQRCFYPNAMINNAKAGFTVWCESDYVNCHAGDPSGKSVSNEGLQLGAPSQCESGYGGGTGGGGWTGGGGTDEGGWDRSASCIRGCEETPNHPECKTANPPQWCKTPVDQCKAACGQGGGGGSSGGGCETSPGGCGGGGNEGGWTPPGFEKPTEKPQCYQDPKTGNMFYGNASIKGWTQVPKNDCESKGIRIGQWWSEPRHPAPGDFSGDQGDMGGFGDYMGDLGGYGGREGGDPIAPEQLGREKKDMLRNMSQRSREVKDMRRSLKDSRSGDPSLASEIDQFENSIGGVTQCFESATDFDAMQDCYDRNNDLNDLTQGIWNKLQAGNIAQNIKNDERELKDMAREITRLEREGQDTGELNSILEEIKSIQAEVRGLLESDPEEAQYRMQDLGDLKRDFWDAMQQVNRGEQEAHLQEFLKDGCRDFEREAKRAPKDVRQEIEALVEECRDIVAQAESDLAGGADPREVEESMRDMQDLWPQFQEIMESQWGDQACHDAEMGLEQAGRAVEEEAPDIIDEVRDENPAIADKMKTLLAKAESILKQGRNALASDNCEGAMDAVDTLHHDISQRFDDLMRQAGVNPDDFGDEEFDYRGWSDEFGFEFEDQAFDRFNERGYGLKDRNLMQRIAAEVLEQYFARQDSDAPDILSSANDLGISTADVQNLLKTKNALMAQIDALRSEIEGLRDELATIVAQVANFTFGEETGKEAEDFVENILPYLEPEEAEERFEELKAAAGEELYDAGLIPFEDTYVGEWYTDDAQVAQELGLVEGTGESDGRELDPARDTNVAETIMMFARLEGIDEDAVPTSDIGASLPEWAQPAAGTLEDAGIDLDAIFGDSEAGDPATRGEVALLLDEVLELEDVDSALSDRFDDIDDATDAEHDAIASVYDAGIMTGYGDSDDFGVDDALNRAALVKILNLSHEEFVGVDGGFHPRPGDAFDFDEEEDTRARAGSVRTEQNTNVETTISGRKFQGTRPSHRGF